MEKFFQKVEMNTPEEVIYIPIFWQVYDSAITVFL